MDRFKGEFMKYVLMCLVSAILFSNAFAAGNAAAQPAAVKEKKIILKSGFTKDQHMAAETACKLIKANMMGRELKTCIKAKLNSL
jgi:hypothetical protein